MFFVNVNGQTVQITFQDLSVRSRNIEEEVIKELKEFKLPSTLVRAVNNFFKNNQVISSNYLRQKNFVNSVKTYIDVVDNKNVKKVYFLHIQVLPKDLNLQYDTKENKANLFKKIDQLSFQIFKLYNTQIEQRDIEFYSLKEYKGGSFLDLELAFYERELNRLYDYLLNYKQTLRDKVICSDKEVGVLIDDLNIMEANPLKQYQFVKVAHQNDLVIFVYSLVDFLQKKRLKYFLNNPSSSSLKHIVLKINNYLQAISSKRNIAKKHISLKELPCFFDLYRYSPEIKKNRAIFDILEAIFSNQLKEGVFFSKSVDLTKIFEIIIEKSLRNTYKENLFIGNETSGKIEGVDRVVADYLNNINFLLCSPPPHKTNSRLRQFPDFLVKECDVFHIIDAKYKLRSNLLKERENFWQILIYAKLFNKASINNLDIIKQAEKVILYAKKSNINLDDFDDLKINLSENIEINQQAEIFNENVFDSSIKLIGLDIFKN